MSRPTYDELKATDPQVARQLERYERERKERAKAPILAGNPYDENHLMENDPLRQEVIDAIDKALTAQE